MRSQTGRLVLCPPQDFQIIAQQCPQSVSHCPPHRTQQVSAWEQRTARTYVRSTGCCRVPLQASSRPARAQHSPRHSQLRTAGRCRPGSGRTCTRAARPGQHRGPAPTASRHLRTPPRPGPGHCRPARPLSLWFASRPGGPDSAARSKPNRAAGCTWIGETPSCRLLPKTGPRPGQLRAEHRRTSWSGRPVHPRHPPGGLGGGAASL